MFRKRAKQDRYRGRVVLVVGGAAGMGLITAKALDERGARIVVADADLAALESVAAAHPAWTTRALDVRDVDAVNELVASVEDEVGPIYRATVTAAIAPGAAFLESDAEAFSRVMRINVEGVANVAYALIPHLVARGEGEFVAYGSVAGEMLTPKLSAYCTSKAAVNAFMEVIAWELRETGVLAHCAHPPGTKTGLLDQMIGGDESSLIATAVEQKIFAEPEDVVAEIERSIDKRRTVSFPMVSAKIIHLMRRASPAFTWWLIGKTET